MPRWKELGKVLRRRRVELGIENPEHLRSTSNRLPPRSLSRGTFNNVEDGNRFTFETFLYLPEFYRVGYLTLLKTLMPELFKEYEDEYVETVDLLASAPDLKEVAEAYLRAPAGDQAAARRVLQVDGAVRKEAAAS